MKSCHVSLVELVKCETSSCSWCKVGVVNSKALSVPPSERHKTYTSLLYRNRATIYVVLLWDPDPYAEICALVCGLYIQHSHVVYSNHEQCQHVFWRAELLFFVQEAS